MSFAANMDGSRETVMLNEVRSVTQSCLTLCDPTDCSPQASLFMEFLKSRIPEWFAIFYSRGIFLTQGSNPHPLHLLPWQADSLTLCHVGSNCDSR